MSDQVSQTAARQADNIFGVLQIAFLTVAVLALAGCTTSTTRAPLPTQVTLAGLSPSPERVSMVDLRTDEARRNRIIEANGTYRYLADEALVPPPVALLSGSIAKSLPHAFRNSPLELTRLDLGFWTTDRISSPSNTQIVIIQGAPASATLVGNLVGHAIAKAIYAAVPVGVRDAAVANIEFRIGEFQITSIEIVAIQGSVSSTQALETAIARALTNLSGKIDAMKYWDVKQALQ